ncbi:electron transfer flavoprotein-ubiquinone oxidoreductase [Photobacterium chitinilyticum]|uniref:Electron transfer flavoprotein-ubiquinone oxidoreductase n=1 Tax=Photobacterium chitinilyticum TaxID=2485123 RepID=A0A444JPI3_9GAMM|nr:electron transfer flavoprotein-ubiquinone oxidoreductase [Photobacterium chitinilyticum]RWX55011.1 electron transfer flavoprotein-ubiquinone oxidoreductase [Photobacterium chitinilyticum]
MEKECMEFDVVIVGAGPAGLSAACRIMQLAQEQDQPLSVCVVEKGAEVGAHILSGAIFEHKALDELFPDWERLNAPLHTAVSEDHFCLLTNPNNYLTVPENFTPQPMLNEGNFVISLANFCRWLAQQAENAGVEIFPGFAAADILYDKQGAVAGIVTSDMGLDKSGEQKSTFEPGIALKAKYTIFAEGARGHLGKQLIANFQLDYNKQPQHYALGIKELWEVPSELHQPGLVIHGVGWPLNQSDTTGGSFLYHLEDNQVAVGLIVDLNYHNPYLSPFDEFQQMKHHPLFSRYLTGGSRIAYGARAITKGGLSSLPRQQFPGGVLVGCDAGTLNFAKIKGSHTAMKSGMLAAEAVFSEINQGFHQTIPGYERLFGESWLYKELYESRNFGAQIHKFGTLIGGALATIEHNWLKHRVSWTVADQKADHECLRPIEQCPPISYPKPDGILSFDKPSSVYLSATQHEENQPCHLKLRDPVLPITVHQSLYGEPSQRYCPAGVYEIVTNGDTPKFQINAANCVHCKTCDIKDPSQNITWVAPEGGGGPNYPNM